MRRAGDGTSRPDGSRRSARQARRHRSSNTCARRLSQRGPSRKWRTRVFDHDAGRSSRRGPRSGGLSGCRPNLGGDLPSTTTSPEGTTERTTEHVPAREDVPTGRARGWMRRLASDCWRRPSLTVAALTASVLGVSLEAVGPLLIGTAVDRAVAGSTAGLGPLVIAMAVIAVVRFGAAFLRRYLGGRLSLGVQHDLRRRVFGSVSRLDGPKQDALRTGQVVSRANSDLQQVQGLLGHGPAGRGHARAAGRLDRDHAVALAAAHGRVDDHPAGRRPVHRAHAHDACSRRRGPRSRAPPRSPSTSRRPSPASASSRASGRRTARRAGCATPPGGSTPQRLRAARFNARLTPTLQALPTLGQLGVFGLGGALAVSGQISLGVFIAFTAYVAALVGPARLVAGLVVTGQLARAGVERVYELIDSQPEIVDAPAAREVPAGPLGVELDDVRFGYARSEPGARRADARDRARRDGGARRHRRVGQVDGRAARPALLRRAGRRAAHRLAGRGRRRARAAPRRPAPRGRRGVRGGVPLLRHRAGQHRLRLPRRHRGADPRRRGRRAGRRVHQRPARRLRHPRRRAGPDPLRRPAPARGARPRPALRPPASSCSTTPRPPSTPPPRPRSARPCRRSPRSAPRS